MSKKQRQLKIVIIGAKEVQKTSFIFKLKNKFKIDMGCDVLIREYSAERKGDAMLMTSPHENGFITGNGSKLAQKGDIFVVMFKTSEDSESFIEAGMLLELLLPLHKNRVILLGDCSDVPLEKQVGCEEDMKRKTKQHMGIKYIEVSREHSQGMLETSQECLSICRRYVFKRSIKERLAKLFRRQGRQDQRPGKLYLAIKYPFNYFYWRSLLDTC